MEVGDPWSWLLHPWAFAFMLSLYAAVLCGAVLAHPDEGAIERAFGRWPAFVIRRLVIPAWVGVWFVSCVSMFVFCLERSWTQFERLFRPAEQVFASLICVVLVAPAISDLATLARTSVLPLKVSLGAVMGLAISAGHGIGPALERIESYGVAPSSIDPWLWFALDRPLMLMALPPLFLLGPAFAGPHRGRRVLLAVALPVVLATVAAMVTVGGGTSLGVPRKLASYYSYAALGRQYGWRKLFILSFTLFISMRLAAHWCAAGVPGAPGKVKHWAVVGTLVAVAYFSDVGKLLGVWYWMGLPLIPLVGVLAACALRPASTPPWRVQLAWLAGCLAAGMPYWLSERYSTYGYGLLGFVVSFVAALVARWTFRPEESSRVLPLTCE